MKTPDSRRLVIRPGAIGDCLVSLPAIESLDPAEVWISTPLVPLERFAEHTCSIQSSGIDLLGLADVRLPPSLLPRLRSFRSILSWYGSNRPEFRDAVSRLDLPFHFLPALPPASSGKHAVDFYLEQTQALRMREVDPVPSIQLRRLTRETIVIHPFSGSPRKNWPMEYFRELAARLPLPVEWCCSPEESLPGARQFDNLRELAEWIGGARLYVGNDSGISHLAAAVGTPSIVLFGATDPAIWSPRGGWVQVLRAPGGRLDELTPAAVWRAIEQFPAVAFTGLARPVC
ncbi:MAG: glycosyltransferase family 9 protein [Acidobacteria bacterium]|nr:glycosyltransferase family 9 protein [Acidobacteriota bacterium]